MGTKFQVVKNGKVLTRVKTDWPKYQRKKDYVLLMWSEKGKGWKQVAKSTYRGKK
jgi:hypothetical protein